MNLKPTLVASGFWTAFREPRRYQPQLFSAVRIWKKGIRVRCLNPKTSRAGGRRFSQQYIIAEVKLEAGRTRIREIPAREGGETKLGRIWDLRRGDHADNRTSPHVHGWRGVILSTLLEFNYLNASIT